MAFRCRIKQRRVTISEQAGTEEEEWRPAEWRRLLILGLVCLIALGVVATAIILLPEKGLLPGKKKANVELGITDMGGYDDHYVVTLIVQNTGESSAHNVRILVRDEYGVMETRGYIGNLAPGEKRTVSVDLHLDRSPVIGHDIIAEWDD